MAAGLGFSPELFNLINQGSQMFGLAQLPPSLMSAPALPKTPSFGALLPGVGGLPGPRSTKTLTGSGPLAVISQNAKKFGLDPAAVLAYALEESSARYGAVGDKGTSFGPFQAHIGGAAGTRTPAQASAWANSPAGLVQMMGMMSRSGARGLTGANAVRAIYSGFGKGTPLAVPRGLARYGQAQQMLQGAQQAAPTFQPTTVKIKGHPYVDPIPPGSQRNRTDQGVDFQAPVGSHVLSVGDAQVVSVSSDPGGYGQMIVYKLTSGPLRGRMIFVGHTTPLVRPGQTLRAGQPLSIAKYTPGSSGPPGWVEMGYASGASLTQARARGETAAGHADTLSGKQFLALLRALGLKY